MAPTTDLKTQIKIKRRRHREITISSPTENHSATTNPSHHQITEPKSLISSVINAPCDWNHFDQNPRYDSISIVASMPFQNPSFPVSPGRISPSVNTPLNYSKFNNALNAGLLNPMSPPSPQTLMHADKTRASPTLFEMMANESDTQTRISDSSTTAGGSIPGKPVGIVQDRQSLLQQRVAEILESRSPDNQFNDQDSSDVNLTLVSKDGFTVSMYLHRHILASQSRFFSGKLSDLRSVQTHLVEISDCDDVEIYMETLRLMYCRDLKRKLMKENVTKVMGILKVASAIGFDSGVCSCLEYLEAAPWSEDEEEKISSLLSELRLDNVVAGEVLKRVSVEVAEAEESSREEILTQLLQVVLEGKDEKARRDMKTLVSKMLRENEARNDLLSKDSLYSACDHCLQILRLNFIGAAAVMASEQAESGDLNEFYQISRQADNLHWIIDMLIDRRSGEDFLKIWAKQTELAEAHARVPALHRHDISRITARFFVGIGKGQILVSKEVRCLLLQTWLGPFYSDFVWMKRTWKGLDRRLIEDGLGNTILTLPLSWQQEILLDWFDRFLNAGDDCPNVQRAFEVWWRRAFWRRHCDSDRPLLELATSGL